MISLNVKENDYSLFNTYFKIVHIQYFFTSLGSSAIFVDMQKVLFLHIHAEIHIALRKNLKYLLQKHMIFMQMFPLKIYAVKDMDTSLHSSILAPKKVIEKISDQYVSHAESMFLILDSCCTRNNSVYGKSRNTPSLSIPDA